MVHRREVLRAGAQIGAAIAIGARGLAETSSGGVEVNDVQSQLNRTLVRQIVTPASLDAIHSTVLNAKRDGLFISQSGGRHSMGGQQFGTETVHIDMRRFNRIVAFDEDRGHVTLESGIQWPELIAELHRRQPGRTDAWSIREKQTGVDNVTLGGSLSSNIHGRGLKYPPIVGDVESFTLIDADGRIRNCSRRENPDLFGLAIGGYGLFGIIGHVTLRLARRSKVRRAVEIIPVKDVVGWVDRRIRDGFVFGDCQYSIDLSSPAADHPGVLSCYLPVAADTPIPANQKALSENDWAELYRIARTNKLQAFQRYSDYYRSTTGQVYWSDTHQLAGNFTGYRTAVDATRGTEMITEVYVTRENFVPFMTAARQNFVDHRVDMSYGTIRFIEKDSETFLPWAKERCVCIVCNLHVRHTDEGKEKAAADFQRIIDRVMEFGGRYFLTYHRWARRDQVEKCYPQFVEFLKHKKQHDPHERFQSDWYRHYRAMFADRL